MTVPDLRAVPLRRNNYPDQAVLPASLQAGRATLPGNAMNESMRRNAGPSAALPVRWRHRDRTAWTPPEPPSTGGRQFAAHPLRYRSMTAVRRALALAAVDGPDVPLKPETWSTTSAQQSYPFPISLRTRLAADRSRRWSSLSHILTPLSGGAGWNPRVARFRPHLQSAVGPARSPCAAPTRYPHESCG